MTYSNLNHTYIIIAGDYLVERFFQKIFNRIIFIPIKNNSKSRKPAPCIKKAAVPCVRHCCFQRVDVVKGCLKEKGYYVSVSGIAN